MISVSRQCELLDLARSSYHYQPEKNESYNQTLMNLIDEQFTRIPFYGVPKMTFWLRREGHLVNPSESAGLCGSWVWMPSTRSLT